jgi:hypothetical protein
MMPFWNSYSVKPLAVSCDGLGALRCWLEDVEDLCGDGVSFPVVSDPTGFVLVHAFSATLDQPGVSDSCVEPPVCRSLTSRLGMLATSIHSDGDLERPCLVPKLLVVDPSKRIRLIQSHHPLYVLLCVLAGPSAALRTSHFERLWYSTALVVVL